MADVVLKSVAVGVVQKVDIGDYAAFGERVERIRSSLTYPKNSVLRIYQNADPGSPLRGKDIDESLGIYPDWLMAVVRLFSENPAADAYVMIEGDSVLCQNALDAINTIPQGLWDRMGVASLYTPEIHGPEIRKCSGDAGLGWGWLPKTERFCGSLCTVWPRHRLLQFLRANAFSQLDTDRQGRGGTDEIIGEWAVASNTHILHHLPSLVRHAGTPTAQKPDGAHRRAFNYPGDDASFVIRPRYEPVGESGKPSDGFLPMVPWAKAESSKMVIASGNIESIPAKRRQRIGMILPVFCTGGMERQVIGLVNHSRGTDGVDWTGLALTDGAPSDQWTIDELRPHMTIYGSPRLADFGRNAEKGISRCETDVDAMKKVASGADALIVWGRKETIADLRSIGYQGRVIFVAHGGCDYTRCTLAGCEHWRPASYVAVSDDAVSAFPEAVRKRVVVIQNGVDPDRVVSSDNEADRKRFADVVRLCIPDIDGRDPLMVGYVGRFSAEKNPEKTALVVAELRRRGIDAVAVYHGVGWSETKFIANIMRITERQCVFVGATQSTAMVYAGLDVLMSVSEREGGPLVAIEAWMNALPFVCTDVGVISHVIKQGHYPGAIVRHDESIARMAQAVYLEASSRLDKSRGLTRDYAMRKLIAKEMAKQWLPVLKGEA